MEKKTYISPETQCIKIETANIIAASPTGGNVYDDTQAESGSTGFSRGDGFWDDED